MGRQISLKVTFNKMQRLLFGAENPPGKKYISGSQDHIGLILPGSKPIML